MMIEECMSMKKYLDILIKTAKIKAKATEKFVDMCIFLMTFRTLQIKWMLGLGSL